VRRVRYHSRIRHRCHMNVVNTIIEKLQSIQLCFDRNAHVGPVGGSYACSRNELFRRQCGNSDHEVSNSRQWYHESVPSSSHAGE
jgi:hypothetical protein